MLSPSNVSQFQTVSWESVLSENEFSLSVWMEAME
jgi:hypothetical protein